MKKKEVTTKSLRTFGLGLTAITALIAGLLYWRNRDYYWILAGLSVLALLPALIRPALLSPVFRVMSKIGEGLGWVNSRVILCLVFFLLFTPTALFLRLIRKDILDVRLDHASKSYWRPAEENDFDPKSLHRQF